MVRKSISLLLSLIMVFSALIVIPLQASAEDVDEPYNTLEDASAETVGERANHDLAEQGVIRYPYSTPIIKKLQNKTAGISIGWKKVSGVSMYRVYLKTAGGFEKLCDTSALSYIYTKVKSGTKYTFTVVCISATSKNHISDYNKSGWSITRFETPKIKSLANKTNGVRITWGKVNKVKRYRVFQITSKGVTKLGESTTTTFTHKTAKSGVKYTYTVCCVSADGQNAVSAYNTKGWAITRFESPTITKLASTTSGVKITWKKVNKAPYYCVYVKSGKSWKKLAVTKSNSYLHKGTKSGTKYTYTVRCLSANRKKFVSDYSTKGWSITYKKQTVNWKSLYKSYVNSHLNSMPWGKSTFKVDRNTPFILHDMDMNGIPELLVGSIGNHLSLQVYTVFKGKVVYAGGLGGRSVVYSTNKSYHGVFCWYVNGTGGSGGLSYYDVSKGKLSNKDVMVYSYNQNTKKRNETVNNQTLYSVYKNSTKNLGEYCWSDIQSNGWNSFFKKFGY